MDGPLFAQENQIPVMTHCNEGTVFLPRKEKSRMVPSPHSEIQKI